jgi:LruC domain-containing protein
VKIDTDGDGYSDDIDAYPTDSSMVQADYAPASDVYGSVAYEALWTNKGDYDFNDVVIDYQYKYGKDVSGKVRQVEVSMKVNTIADYKDGIGIMFEGMADKISSVSGVGNVTGISVTNGIEDGNGADGVIIISTDQKNEIVTLNVTINFSDNGNGVEKASLGDAPHNIFIFSQSTRGREIHLPGNKYTAKMDTNYFNTGDDSTSESTQTTTFKTADELPWALHIAEKFDYPKEGKSIVEAYSKFDDWAQSGGSASQDWYSNETYKDNTKITER